MPLSFSPRGWSIRIKGVLLAVAYLLALSAVYGTFTVYLLEREKSQAHDRLQQTAGIVAAEINAYVSSGAQRLETVRRLPGLAYGLQNIQEAPGSGYIPPWTTLHYLFFKSPVFTGGVLLLDRTGKVLWTEPPGLPWLHEAFTDMAPVAEMLQTRRSVISPVLDSDRLLGHPHVLAGVPIENSSGDLQGLLVGVIDLTASGFNDMMAAMSTTDGRFVEVIDQNGVVLAGTSSARLFRRAEPVTTDGQVPMLASVPLARAPWHVLAGQPRAHALAAVWQSQRALWGIGIALLLLAAATAAPLLNGFVRSIKHLTDAVETVARGDLSQPVIVGNRHDELATLAHAFEQMRLELGRSRRTLEQRLEEREELISLLVRANEELRLAQARLIEAERFAAIGELSAAVAHGIRNPVAGIKAAAQFAILELPEHHPLHENVTDIIAEANKLEARIKTLLNFAKPFEPNLAPCRIEQIVADAVASLRGQMAAQGIDLVVDLDPILPTAQLDYAQIEQVLLALLSNAVEAMPNGGRITITGRLAADGRTLRLEVTDTGPGIAAEQLEPVFRLFFTTKSSGTGLGLAVTKKIVERHGGTIAVASEHGRGTCFTIELPVSPASSQPPTVDDGGAAHRSPQRSAP
jgi:signal transduction histidine kinase